MFFLLRVAFWLTLVFLLLPGLPNLSSGNGEGEGGASGASKVNAFEALGAASAAVSDASGFCSRQPQACVIGSSIIDMLGERAEAGAKLVMGYVTEQIVDQKRRAAERANESPAGDTLTTHDLGPAWQGARPGTPEPAATVPAASARETAPTTGQNGPAAHVPLPPKKPA